MPKHSACNLGSINLSEFVQNPFTAEARFDYNDFITVVHTAVRGLDQVIDENLNNHALPEQKEMAMNYRNIGLGIMGLHDCLIKMGITYGTNDSIYFIDGIMHTMFREAVKESNYLAEKKGTFPNYSPSLFDSDIIKNHFIDNEIEELKVHGMRNCSLLSIAPTGSLGTMLNISTGCEPLFALYYNRKTESLNDGEDKYYKVYTGIAEEYMNSHSGEELPSYFNCSKDIGWKDRIKMQSCLQDHVDTAISSTINLPNETTVEEIEQLYLYAWKHQLKGITIFRDGCKRMGILTTGEADTETEDIKENQLQRGEIIDCSDELIGKKRKLMSGCGSLHCLAYFDPNNGNLQEVYLNKGSTGGCVDADTEYFNGSEWKKISDYNPDSDEKVLQYNKDGTANLVKPVNYIVNDNVDYLKKFTNTIGLDMVLSEDHRMYLYKNFRKYSMGIRKSLSSEIVTVKDYISREGKKERHVPTTFKYNARGICVPDNMIRLLVAVYADGTYDGHKIIMVLKKDRKKIRLRELLTKCDIGYSERNINNTDCTQFCFYPVPSIAEWFTDKQFTPKWYDCDDRQLEIVTDECVYWDGSVGDGNRLGEYFTSKKEEADFMQFALTRLGYRTTIGLNSSNSNEKNSYRIRWTKQNTHNLAFAKIEDYKTVDGHSYCFTVPSGLLVLRRNNQIFVTGNCNNFMNGLSRMISLACRAGVSITDIKDQLDSTGVCPSYATRTAKKHDTSRGTCCPNAVGHALIEMWKEVQTEINGEDEPEQPKTKKTAIKAKIESVSNQDNKENSTKCPVCGEPLRFEGGCNSCPNCGFSKCD